MVRNILQGKTASRVVAVVGALAFALQGYDQAVANGLLTLPSFTTTFPGIDTIDVTGSTRAKHADIQGTTVAIYEIGCAIGALACFFIGDLLGRRKTVFLAGCVVLVGVAIQASAFSLAQFIIARIITGLGVGGLTATVPMYVVEASRPESRGRRVLLQGWLAIGGIVIASWLEFGMYYVKQNPVSWRFPIAFQAVFALVVVSTILFLPESPRWLAQKGRVDESVTSLALLANVPPDSQYVASEIENIQTSLSHEHVAGRESQFCASPFARTENRHLHRTILAISINILAQMTGVNIITFYSNSIFEGSLGFSGTTARIISGCLQIWQFLAAGLAVLLVDRYGRRRLLIAGAVGMAISHACLAGLTSATDNQSAAGASVFFFFLALFSFPIGLFLVPFMYAAEISPPATRAKVSAMSAAANWLFNFLLAEVTPVAFTNIAWRYYIVYACTSVFAAVFFFFLLPETRGRTLEEIDEVFVQSNSFLSPVAIAKARPQQNLKMAEHDRVDSTEKVLP